jgi:hypothetical protein
MTLFETRRGAERLRKTDPDRAARSGATRSSPAPGQVADVMH